MGRRQGMSLQVLMITFTMADACPRREGLEAITGCFVEENYFSSRCHPKARRRLTVMFTVPLDTMCSKLQESNSLYPTMT